jgi:hypothetical protein
MPFASSIDLIITSTNDILQALQNPTANSPLAPLANSKVDVLRHLSNILSQRKIAPIAATPALRVATPATAPAPGLRVISPVTPITPKPNTFHNTTGTTGLRLRRNHRKQSSSSPTPTINHDAPTTKNIPGQMIDEILKDEHHKKHGHLPPMPFGFNGCVPSPSPPQHCSPTHSHQRSPSHRYPTQSQACLVATSASMQHSASSSPTSTPPTPSGIREDTRPSIPVPAH